MSTYLARCDSCKAEKEYEAKISKRDVDVPKCKYCKQPMTRIMPRGQKTHVIFKGDNWACKKGY